MAKLAICEPPPYGQQMGSLTTSTAESPELTKLSDGKLPMRKRRDVGERLAGVHPSVPSRRYTAGNIFPATDNLP